MKTILPLILSGLFAQPALADGPLFSADFEDEAVVQKQWTPQGADKDVALIASNHAASGQHSLSLSAASSTKSAAWLSETIDLPQEVIDAGAVQISWKQLHSVPPGNVMRFSVVFLGGDSERNSKHFAMEGNSEGWQEGTFTEKQEMVPVPQGATQLKLKLSSAARKGSQGEAYLDDVLVGN